LERRAPIGKRRSIGNKQDSGVTGLSLCAQGAPPVACRSGPAARLWRLLSRRLSHAA